MKKWIPAVALCILSTMGIASYGNIKAKDDYVSPVTISTTHNYDYKSGYFYTLRGDTDEVKLTNPTLEAKLKTLLGLNTDAKLLVNSIMSNPSYHNPDNPTKADITCLDLSNTGIKDITELAQFAWPTTLKSINLAGNGLTNADFEKVKTFVSLKAGTSIPFGETTITSVSDYSAIINSINLCFNEINLSNVSSADLNNQKYIYGIQGVNNLDPSGLIQTSEMENVKYFVRLDDLNFISPSIKRNNADILEFNEVKTLHESSNLGKVDINIKGVTTSPTGYYNTWEQSTSFSMFTITLDPNFTIERRSQRHDLIANAITVSLEINANISIIGNPDTYSIGKKTLNVRVVSDDNKTRIVQLQYTVVDTIRPVITLVGPKIVYWSKNKAFDHNKYTCTVSDSGDPLNSFLQMETDLDETKISPADTPYTITYKAVDKAGNAAIPVVRYVYIQEQALDTINLRSNTTSLVTGNDITLEIKPDDNIPMEDYEGFTFEYRWYVDDVLEGTTQGDFNGKSTKSFIFKTPGMREVRVELSAKKGTQLIEVSSSVLYLDIEVGVNNNQILIIATSIAILLIILVITVITFIKYKRAKGGHYSKRSKPTTKKKKVDTKPDRPQITIIQGVNPNGTLGGNNGGGGGNTLDRKPEPPNQNDQMGK